MRPPPHVSHFAFFPDFFFFRGGGVKQKKCTPANQSLTCFREGAGVAEELNKVNDRYEEEKIQVQTAHKAAEKASKPQSISSSETRI